jgi:hypothetical protein
MAEHETLAEALAAFQAELPRIRKDETAKVTGEGKNGPVKYTYGYAGLDAVVEAVMPVLGKHGLSITSKTAFDQQGNFMLEVSLLHESGQRETGYWPLPDPRRVGPQDLGSAITYGRRYLKLALTGTFPGGEDDDGAKAQQSARDSWEDARPRRQVDDRQQQAGQEPQAAASPPKPKTSWTDAEVATYVARLAKVELPAAIQAYDWMASKDLHNRKVGDANTTATDTVARRIAEGSFAGSVDEIAALKTIAADRGLLKVQVSETETLDQALYEARELAVHAAVEQAKADTPNPDDLKAE